MMLEVAGASQTSWVAAQTGSMSQEGRGTKAIDASIVIVVNINIYIFSKLYVLRKLGLQFYFCNLAGKQCSNLVEKNHLGRDIQ